MCECCVYTYIRYTYVYHIDVYVLYMCPHTCWNILVYMYRFTLLGGSTISYTYRDIIKYIPEGCRHHQQQKIGNSHRFTRERILYGTFGSFWVSPTSSHCEKGYSEIKKSFAPLQNMQQEFPKIRLHSTRL